MPRPSAGGSAARSLIEVLESRRLLAAHCFEPATTTTNQTTAISAVVPAEKAADASAPVQRLGSGSHFSGYNYIPPDGSEPPPVSVVVEINGGQLTAVSSGGLPVATRPPKKLQPSDVGLPAPADAGPALTPLAQTPAAPSPLKSISGKAAGLRVPNVAPVAVRPAASQAPLKVAAPHATMYPGPVAMADPAEVVLAANPSAVVGIADGLAYASNKAADALALISPPDGLSADATFNFVHFNPAILLNDAMAGFSRESVALSFVPMPMHSTAHAWSITAAVIGVDLLLIGHCYQKNRRAKLMAARFAENHIARR